MHRQRFFRGKAADVLFRGFARTRRFVDGGYANRERNSGQTQNFRAPRRL
jgi:hypothetical protein